MKTIILFLCCSFLVLPVFAVTLTGSAVELTTSPSASPCTNFWDFDSKGQLVAWRDLRDNINNIPAIYVTFLNDPTHTEYLVDDSATNSQDLRTDGQNLVYSFWDGMTPPNLRIVDITNISAPVINDTNLAGYINTLDIDGGVVVYADDGSYGSYIQRIYAFKINDPTYTKHALKEFGQTDYLNSNVVIENNLVTYSGYEYDIENSIYGYYLETINITDINNPVITRNYLPVTPDSDIQINQIQVSGDWLVATGYYYGKNCIFGIHHYRDPDSSHWTYSVISQLTGKSVLPGFDAPFVVWIENSGGMPSLHADIQPFSQAPTGQKLMGAVLFDNDKTTKSTLLNFTDLDWTMDSAAISGNKVVWGGNYYHYDDELGGVYYSDLFTADVQMQCGDKGYFLADINHDCKVDFVDFALFAEKWLQCTNPDNDQCTFGDVYSAGDNLWSVQ